MRRLLPLALAAIATLLLSPFARAQGYLFIANQGDHTALLVEPTSGKLIFAAGVDINGHESAVSPDGHFGYVPIYGNAGVGKPGTDGATIHVIDLQKGRVASVIDLGQAVRPHAAHFGPDGLLYVTAELANSVFVVDTRTQKVIARIPTGAAESHMLAISPDGSRGYTANVGPGSVSVLDLRKRALIAVIPVAQTVQRISISPDGRWVYTHDQGAPRIAVIDTSTNKVARWIDLPSTVYSSATTPDGSLLLALSPSGKLYAIDPATGHVPQTFDVPAGFGEVLITPDGTHAYVSCPTAGTIEGFELHPLKHTRTMNFPRGVDGLSWLSNAPN